MESLNYYNDDPIQSELTADRYGDGVEIRLELGNELLFVCLPFDIARQLGQWLVTASTLGRTSQ